MKKLILILLSTLFFFGIKSDVLGASKDEELSTLVCQYKTSATYNKTKMVGEFTATTYLYCQSGYCKFKPTYDWKLAGRPGAIFVRAMYGETPEGMISAYRNIRNATEFSDNKTKCPAFISFQWCDNHDPDWYFSNSSSYDPFKPKSGCQTVNMPNVYSKNADEEKPSVGGDTSSGGNAFTYEPPKDVILPFCQETYKVWRLAGFILFALKVLVPSILIVLGSIDLGKAVLAQNEDEIKKGTQLLIKRVIAGVIIFFIPLLVKIVFGWVAGASAPISENNSCIICITDPGSC